MVKTFRMLGAAFMIASIAATPAFAVSFAKPNKTTLSTTAACGAKGKNLSANCKAQNKIASKTGATAHRN